jgi:TRAP-type mannitol/chloroaromatic compound transport system substrate-binding protein
MRVISLAMLVALFTSCGDSGSNTATTPLVDQQTYNWTMITSWPRNMPAVGTAPVAFAEQVGRMSAGRLNIRVYGANELVGGLEVFDAVANGTAEIGHSTPYYWQGKIAAAPFFSSIPFGMTGTEMDAWLAYGGGNCTPSALVGHISPIA